MDDENDSLTIDTASPPPLTIPIIEQNDILLSSLSTNIPIISSEIDEKSVTFKDNETIEENSSSISNLDYDKIPSPLAQSHSPQQSISTILDTIITQIETDTYNQLNSLPIIEDDQMEVEDDDDDDDDNEEEEEEQEMSEKNSSNETAKTEKERSTTKISLSSSKRDFKPTTRTLRSHARGKLNLSTFLSGTNNNIRRVSNRRRALENKLLISASEKEKKRKSLSERSRKDKDTLITNDEIHTSSNSDDQTLDNTNGMNICNNQNT